MLDSPYFRFAIWVLVLFLIILVGSQISFIFHPLVVIVQTVFFPILLSGVLYYLMVPTVDRLTEKRVPRGIAILLIYLAFAIVVTILVLVLGPILQRQIGSLIENAPTIVNGIRVRLLELQDHPYVLQLAQQESFTFEDLARRLSQYINQIFVSVVNNVASFFGTLTNVFTTLLMIPFILFYMLQSGEKLPGAMTRFLPKHHQKEGKSIIYDMDRTLSAFIQGQIIVCLCVGVLCYIGFMLIGIDYPLILAIVAMVTNVIPFVGPFIGAIPAIIVAILHSPTMVVKVAIVIIIVQQIESMFISPRIMGDKLAIHPVTIILIILIAGRLAGFLGLILAIPTYAILKVIASYMYRFVKLRMGWDHK
ncbi:AI-2E family transporter [Desulfuribacillus stibiiarsenatis]|uniref:AI-2E family transporter n=1 Tax=Desulfuribacillus stibiiarsenatis TaxID=1390249 RepID=A0A1E5L5B6_9FIRM|nr:AI-2E family transporter [Desulfuribacillus stibiiarsenatis]OEH85310.1 AI-2E family transporter [Desulfuribacillus stibiiarsenatis]